MPAEKDDHVYLWDMIDAARSALEFAKGMSFSEYKKDRKTQLAVERAIEIIGEGARFVSKPFKESHPEIPWEKIIRQRHVLAHDYGEIDQKRIWALIETHIPELISMLEPLIPDPKKE